VVVSGDVLVSGGRVGDGEVNDGEVDSLSGLGVKAPRTACRAALQLTRRRRRRQVSDGSVEQVAVAGRHLDRL